MPDSMIDDLSRRWAALSVTGRFALVASIVAGLGILALVVLWSKRPDYRALFTGLKGPDAAAITHKLKEMKVPYEVSDDGTILVPSAVLYTTRMELAGSGLPEAGSAGFELFDKTRFQTSPLSEKVTYVRALQGELEHTISSLQEVESVRIHLVLPQREILTDDSKGTSASIVLKVRSGATLNAGQVRAIKALVAGSVPNLAKDNITVMDTRGSLLSSGDDTTEAGGASSLMDLQRSEEKKKEHSIQEMLDQVLGSGMAVVRVSMQLDNNQRVVESQTFQPTDPKTNTGILRSKQIVDEGYTGQGGRPVMPSTQAGQKAATLVSGGQGSSNYKNARETDNYEINNTREKQVVNPGGIKRMTVAVALSNALKLNRPALDDITDMVTKAAGADPARKDEVKVAVVPFNKAVENAEVDPGALKELQEKKWMEWGRITAPVLAVMMFWLLAGRLGRAYKGMALPNRGTRQLGGSGAPMMAGGVPGGTAHLGDGGARGARPAGVGGTASQQLDSLGSLTPLQPGSDVSAIAPEHLGLHARMVAMDDPQATANLLEKWMGEGE